MFCFLFSFVCCDAVKDDAEIKEGLTWQIMISDRFQ